MKFKDVIVAEQWSQKYKNSINCSHPKGFSQRAHCAGKKKHNESIEMEMVCEDCGMCQTHGNINEIAKGQKDANGYTRCWPGKHAEGTKKGKNGGQVRNCVPNESVEEAVFAPKGPRKFDPELADFIITMNGRPYMTVKGHSKAMEALKALAASQAGHKWGVQADKKSAVAEAATAAQQAAIAINMKKHHQKPKGMTEGSQRVDSLVTDALKIMRGSEVRDAVSALKTVLGDREYNQRRGHYNFYVRQMLDMYGQQGVAEADMNRRGFLKGLGAAVAGAAGLGAANAGTDDPEYNRKVQQQHQEMMEKNPRYAKEHADLNIVIVRGISGQSAENNKRWYQKTAQLLQKYGVRVNEGVAEDYDSGEYNDEAGMAQGNLHTIAMAAQGLLDTIDDKDNLPEWAQEKIAKVEGMLVTVWNYLQSQEAQGIDPEVEEMYEAMDELAEEMAAKKGVSADLVWETFEAMDDNMLYETAAWRRKEGKSKKGGLNAKGVASYRREHPGSKLQTAVTTKPSKLKPGSKAAKRRKSFCARMSGVKGPMKKPNGKPTRKALALRKWNC